MDSFENFKHDLSIFKTPNGHADLCFANFQSSLPLAYL